MSAIELFHQDGKAAGVYYCSVCRAVSAEREISESCHGKCVCGKDLKQYERHKCGDCSDKEFRERERQKEAERFAKAAKFTPEEYAKLPDSDGWVYCDGPSPNYWDSVEEFLEHAENAYADPSHVPDYVWAAKNEGVTLATTDSLIENMLDSMWEDADSDDLNGLEELESAVAAFNQANKNIAVYHPDYSRAILLSPRAILGAALMESAEVKES